MEKNFLQRLQKIKINDILHIFLFILAIIPSLIYKITHKPFWLICDYKDEARDNGYYFYKYICENHKEKPVWYAINKKSPDYKKVKHLGKVVRYGSFFHWILYLSASINISSQKGGKPNAAICYFLEVYELLKNKRVFLQHGIIKDDLPYVYYKNAKFSLFTTSTKKEYEYVNKNFGYPSGVIRQLGLCRFDDLVNTSDNQTILIMPTWRQWISNSDYKTKDVEDFKSFKETQYFKTWTSLLSSKELYVILRKNNKKIIFYPHRNMQVFIDDFKYLENDVINIASFPTYDVHNLLKEAYLLITDYSSVAMDFCYMNKPVIYYQFDHEKFRKHHMKKSYFSYINDGFGKVIKEEKELIKEISNNINVFTLEDRYQKRVNDFFDLRDNKNNERTYYAVKELERKK